MVHSANCIRESAWGVQKTFRYKWRSRMHFMLLRDAKQSEVNKASKCNATQSFSCAVIFLKCLVQIIVIGSTTKPLQQSNLCFWIYEAIYYSTVRKEMKLGAKGSHNLRWHLEAKILPIWTWNIIPRICSRDKSISGLGYIQKFTMYFAVKICRSQCQNSFLPRPAL